MLLITSNPGQQKVFATGKMELLCTTQQVQIKKAILAASDKQISPS